MKDLKQIQNDNNTVNVIINAGLNVGNQEPENQLQRTLEWLKSPKHYRIEEGEWQGIKERTLIVRTSFPSMTSCIKHLIKACIALKQDAIAVYFEENKHGKIIYHPDYKGDRDTFKPEFFTFNWSGNFFD
ncbi:MAG: hypothetical protein ACOCWC_04885 [Bacteroidota bacterium]